MRGMLTQPLLGVPSPDAFGSYVQPLSDDFGWSRVEINVAMTVNFVVYSLMGPVVGWSLDKHGARVTASSNYTIHHHHTLISMGEGW